MAAPSAHSRSLPPARKRTRPQPRPDALAFTVNEVRQLGGPGRTKVYELIAQGELRAVTVGGRRLINGDSFRALLLGATQRREG